MNSPLGQYAPLVASIVAVLVIVGYLAALVFKTELGIDDASMSGLQALALVAVGAVFGSAVSVNGWKQPLAAAHERIDALEAGTGVTTHPEAETVKPA